MRDWLTRTCMMCHRPSQQSLPCPRGAVEQYSLGLRDPQALKQLWMLDGELNDLLDLLNLLIQPSNHVVSRIRHLLHLHKTNEGVHFAGEDQVQLQEQQTVSVNSKKGVGNKEQGIRTRSLLEVYDMKLCSFQSSALNSADNLAVHVQKFCMITVKFSLPENRAKLFQRCITDTENTAANFAADGNILAGRVSPHHLLVTMLINSNSSLHAYDLLGAVFYQAPPRLPA
jgi:hypothetical protein